MKILIKKEITSLLSSPVALFFLTGFLVASGLMSWLFSGNFNIMDSGYANLIPFFRLVPFLFIILIPALTMRSFSEEKKSKNLDIFRSRPKNISSLFISKLLACWLIVFIALLCTFVYIYSIYTLAQPAGNIDLNEIIASYISLLLFSLVFVVIGLFSSSLTKNQIVAFIIAIILNFLVFYGFDLLAGLFSNLRMQLVISSFGLSSHYDFMQKGVIQYRDILVILTYILTFSLFAVYILSLNTKRSKRNFILGLGVVILLNVISLFIPDFRIDFTSDKRYTVSGYTKQLLSQVSEEDEFFKISVYLDGNLNSGFQRLQNEVRNTLADFKHYSKGRVKYEFINPYSTGESPEKVYETMSHIGMPGIVLNEVDREGKASQKMIYPYALIMSGNDTLNVNLLKNIAGYSAEENLNASVENLEFEFTDGLRLITMKEPHSIAFIEGHGEIPRTYVYDAEELLSKYFFVNRGQIINNISVLDEFRVVIIAGAIHHFSEQEKYILDQYIMAGGRVLWLIDGVYLSHEELAENSYSPSIKNDVNLDDMLFKYGVRINPVLLQDTQSTSIYLTSGEEGNNQYIKAPWYYSPLLLPSIDHPITKDISLVKAEFASSIDIVDKNASVSKSVLLTTSAHTHVVDVPERIELNLSEIQPTGDYFNKSYLPVAISLKGQFRSLYENRIPPDSVNGDNRAFKPLSALETKMIVVSCSDIIRNDIIGYEQQTQILPMGFDRMSNHQYGNRDFIVNAVNWLANDDEWFSLKSKQQQIRLLDRQQIYANRIFYTVINILFPLLFVGLIIVGFNLFRRYKYRR